VPRIGSGRERAKGRGRAACRPALSFSCRSRRDKSNALELWEDWDRAQPFTAGKHFFNVGETHDAAFAVATFGSVHKIPKDFDGWEDLARKVEKNYVRGWTANDGTQMFLWGDLSEVVLSADHFGYFTGALIELRARGYATPRTALWDRGGDHYVGVLGELALLDGKTPQVSRKGRRR
jgi:hypothetical protein